MSTDVERIATGAEDVHQLWASPLEIGLGIWLLQRQLGFACVIPVVIALGKATSRYNPLRNVLTYASLHALKPIHCKVHESGPDTLERGHSEESCTNILDVNFN